MSVVAEGHPSEWSLTQPNPNAPSVQIHLAETWRGQQSLEARAYGTFLARPAGQGARKVQVRVHRDAYDFQSYGQVLVWTDSGWVEAYRCRVEPLPIGEVSHVCRDDSRWVGLMQQTCRALLDRWVLMGAR